MIFTHSCTYACMYPCSSASFLLSFLSLDNYTISTTVLHFISHGDPTTVHKGNQTDGEEHQPSRSGRLRVKLEGVPISVSHRVCICVCVYLCTCAVVCRIETANAGCLIPLSFFLSFFLESGLSVRKKGEERVGLN